MQGAGTPRSSMNRILKHTMAFSANARISLIALGARFLKVAPCTCYPSLLIRHNSCLQSSARCRTAHSKVRVTAIRGLHQTERTLLWRWMVYSRATTSSMALRPWVLPAVGLLDLEAWGMATVVGGGGLKLSVSSSSLSEVSLISPSNVQSSQQIVKLCGRRRSLGGCSS